MAAANSRFAIPGHAQQGALRAGRLAVQCRQAREVYAGNLKEEIMNDDFRMDVVSVGGVSAIFEAI